MKRPPTPAELIIMGHRKQTPLQAIRSKCLDCCCGSPKEVTECTARSCALWPFRLQTSPWTAAAMRRSPSADTGDGLHENSAANAGGFSEGETFNGKPH